MYNGGVAEPALKAIIDLLSAGNDIPARRPFLVNQSDYLCFWGLQFRAKAGAC